MLNTSVTADLSSWNGVATILGERKAVPDHDDNERTRPFKAYSLPHSQNMRLFSVPLEIAYDTLDALSSSCDVRYRPSPNEHHRHLFWISSNTTALNIS